MKTTMKVLAASVALAVSGAANAAIETGQYAPGELFLTVWDDAGQQSYGLDLGISQYDFTYNMKSNSLSFDLAADANYAGFLGKTNLVYQIVAADMVSWDYTSYGMLSTARDGAPTNIKNDADLNIMMAKVADWSLNLNADSGDAANPALNLSGVSVPGDLGYYDSLTWGTTNGGMGFVAAQLVGQSVGFYKFNLDSNDDWSVFAEELPNVWTLGTDGQLTYSAAVSAVPVPAAVWLFGSGLLGLASIARRRKA